MRTVSNAPTRSGGSGRRRSCSTQRTGNGAPASSRSMNATSAGSTSTTARLAIVALRAVVTHEQPKRKRGQVVVAEQEHAAADERTCLVDREEAPELRVDRAVALVELEPRGRPGPDCPRELAHERRERRRDDDSAPTAAGARRGSSDSEAAGGEELAAGGRQPRRSLLRHDRALAELAADGGDDRHRQLGRPADAARRDRLEPGQRGQDRAHAPLALGQPDGGRHLADDALRLSQVTAECSEWTRARRRAARGSSPARRRRRWRRR